MILAIFCPSEYLCSGRVVRKVSSLTRHSSPARIILVGCSAVVQEAIVSEFSYAQICASGGDISSATHAIVFADRFTEFNELSHFKNEFVRYIYTPITRVVNVKRIPDNFEIEYLTYVGRGTPFGNPHPMQETGSRDKSIDFYKYDLERELLGDGNTKQLAIQKLLGRFLGCSCKPLRCHGDILADYLNSIDIDEIDTKLKKQCWFYKFRVTISRSSNIRD